MTAIRLRADYQSWPTWRRTGDEAWDNIDPADLPISPGLRADLKAWADLLDRTLNWDDPGGTVWPPNFWSDFNGRGRALAARLKAELGPDYRVEQHLWGEDDKTP